MDDDDYWFSDIALVNNRIGPSRDRIGMFYTDIIRDTAAVFLLMLSAKKQNAI